MKKLILLLTLIGSVCSAQIVTLSPKAPNADQEIEIIYDATLGTGGLKGATSIYMHSGVILSGPDKTDWQNVQGNWGKDDGIGKMTKVAGQADKWSIKLSPKIRDYYKVPNDTKIFRLAMVFRNADGTKEGKGTAGLFDGGEVGANQDIYLNLTVDKFVQILQPSESIIYLEKTKTLNIQCKASSISDKLSIEVNDGSGFKLLSEKANTQDLNFNYLPEKNGPITVRTKATFGTEIIQEQKTFEIKLIDPNKILALPTNLKKGINYNASDPTKAYLVLEAPKKKFVYVVGDFNDWDINKAIQMNQTPSGELFWIEISNLVPKKEYVFQYWVEGTIKIGDPYSEKVADPWNDSKIDANTYPSLPKYDKTENGIASVIQTQQDNFVWNSSEANKPKPDKNELMIYELLVRDFVATHNYKTLADTLPYLKKLGINAIELMPIMEFEGNESWGYNPSYFFAPDKYYGSKNDLKNFIQKAHQQGMVVFLDMVLNHAFGQNPLVKMYWENGKPAADSPWFNTDATHPFNVGYDFNHESKYTQAFVDSVNNYWLSEYHFDGFRFDLSKGFTQKKNTDVELWSQYDASRIAILKRMNAQIKKSFPNAYVILEHFAAEPEETELINDGMMVWRNSTYDYGNLLTGNASINISAASNLSRVSYMESHDEERLMVKAINSPASIGPYAVKDKNTALNRIKMLSAFFYTLTGPKMVWQFQELGYDVAIDFNGRTGNKPYPWGATGLKLYEDKERQKLLKVNTNILALVNENRIVFSKGTVSKDLASAVKSINILHDNLNVMIIGNFDLKNQSISADFKKSGKWYDYFSKDSLTLAGTTQNFNLYPGEFHIYTSKKQKNASQDLVDFVPKFTINPGEFTENTEITINLKDPGTTFGSKVNLVLAPVVESIASTNSLTAKKAEMTKDNLGNWSFKFTPKAFLGTTTEIFRLALYFENGDGSQFIKNDKDPYYVNVKSEARIVTVSPAAFNANTPITIVYNANVGTAGLIGATNVYMHSGIITTSETATDWKYVVGNWGKDDGIGKMKQLENNKWEISITPKSYFKDVPSNATWYRIGMVFRNADGTKEGKETGGKDIFVNFNNSLIGEVLSIDNENTEIKVYPNPSSEAIFIKSSKPIKSYKIFDIKGMLLHVEVLLNNELEVEIPKNTVKHSGQYIIQINNEENSVSKIISIY